MSKRFVSTDMIRKRWYREMNCRQKALWEHMRLSCDIAGVMEIDWDAISFSIGETVTAADLEPMKNQFVILPCGKLWLKDFILFQYGRLSEDCKPHSKVIECLQSHGMTPDDVNQKDKNNPRQAIKETSKRMVLERDGHHCVYCSKGVSNFDLTFDHLIPIVRGGKDSVHNLVVCCRNCNNRKATLTLQEFAKIQPIPESLLNTLLSRVASTLQEEDKEEDQDKEQDEEELWYEFIKSKYAKIGVDVESERVKAEAWLSIPRNRHRRFSHQFFINWLNKADRNVPAGGNNGSRSEWLRAAEAVANMVWDAKGTGPNAVKKAMQAARDKFRDCPKFQGRDAVQVGIDRAMNNERA